MYKIDVWIHRDLGPESSQNGLQAPSKEDGDVGEKKIPGKAPGPQGIPGLVNIQKAMENGGLMGFNGI